MRGDFIGYPKPYRSYFRNISHDPPKHFVKRMPLFSDYSGSARPLDKTRLKASSDELKSQFSEGERGSQSSLEVDSRPRLS